MHQQKKLNASGRPGAAKLMQPMTLLVKLTVLLFGVLFWLANIGINITTVLGALGVGGLALALALQKPIEDMMGALTLFTQAPIRVGDLCKYGPVMGTIEDIGLRSSKRKMKTHGPPEVPPIRFVTWQTDPADRERINPSSRWPRRNDRSTQGTGASSCIPERSALSSAIPPFAAWSKWPPREGSRCYVTPDAGFHRWATTPPRCSTSRKYCSACASRRLVSASTK